MLVTVGAKHAIFNALPAAARRRRRGGHPRAVLGVLPGHGAASGGTPVVVPCPEADGFLLSAAALEAAITPAHQLADPQLAEQSDGRRLQRGTAARPGRGAAAAPAGAWCMTDDIYEKIASTTAQSAASSPSTRSCRARAGRQRRVQDLRDDGLAHRLRGRPAELIGAMDMLQSRVDELRRARSARPPRWPRCAATRAFCRAWVATYQSRRDVALLRLNEIAGLSCSARRAPSIFG